MMPLVLLCALAACQGWYRVPVTGPEPRQLPNPVLVTETDGTRYEMRGAAVERDSVIGVVGRAGERTRWALPLSAVRRIDERDTRAAEITTMLAMGLTALIIAAGTVLQPST